MVNLYIYINETLLPTFKLNVKYTRRSITIGTLPHGQTQQIKSNVEVINTLTTPLYSLLSLEFTRKCFTNGKVVSSA